MFLGELFGPLFFILLVIASLSSSISLLEPSVAYFSEEKIISRKKAAFLLGSISWFLGIGSALSFNYLQEFYLLPNMNILDSIVFIGNNLLLPLGGLFVALFLGWFADKKLIAEQLKLSPPAQGMWLFFIRFVAPLAVFSILISQFLVVVEDISFPHLRNLIFDIVYFIFGEGTQVRFRPSYFPFTEPSAEVDIYFEDKKAVSYTHLTLPTR